MEIKLDNSLKEKYKLDDYSECFSIYENDENIGFSAINNNSNNMIYIYVEPNYRGNGFGTKIFEEMITHFDDKIVLTIDSNNTVMYRMISHYNPSVLERSVELTTYQINRMV